VAPFRSLHVFPSRRAAVILIGLLFAAKVAVAYWVPLVGDEAYYVLWSRALSPGYYDHPPMVAFFIRGGTLLFGETPFGARFVPLLSGLATTALVWLVANRVLDNPRAGAIAACFFAVSLFGFLGQAVATPDAPLTLFTAAMFYWGIRALQDGHPVDWLIFGTVTGLAIESKYSSLLLATGFALAALSTAAMRRRLMTAWPWLASTIALLIVLPNFIWNARFGWATFTKQGGRLVTTGVFGWHYLIELIAAQVALLSPIIFLFAIVGCLNGSRPIYRDAATRNAFLTVIAAPTGYFVFHALRARVEGNWPGFLFPAYAVLGCAGFLAVLSANESSLRRMCGAAIPLALSFAFIADSVVSFAPFRVLGRADPILRLSRGWQALAADVEATRRATGASYILTDNYQVNAELSLYLPEVPIAQLDQRERYRPLGEPESAVRSGIALMIGRSRHASLDAVFTKAEPQAPLTRQFDGIEIERYQSLLLSPGSE